MVSLESNPNSLNTKSAACVREQAPSTLSEMDLGNRPNDSQSSPRKSIDLDVKRIASSQELASA